MLKLLWLDLETIGLNPREYEEARRRNEAGDAEFHAVRQAAKAVFFGHTLEVPDTETLCLFARNNYGVTLTKERAEELKERLDAYLALLKD